MNKILMTAAIALTGLAFAPAAFAQDDPAKAFDTVDTDKSGDISLTELMVVLPDFDETKFAAADTDSSGGLSAEEYALVPGGGAPAESLTEENAEEPAPASN